MEETRSKHVIVIEADLGDTQRKLDDVDKQVDEIENKASRSGGAFSHLGASISGAFAGLSSKAGDLWSKFTLPSGAFSAKAQKIRSEIDKINEKLDDLENRKTPTDHYAWLSDALRKAEKQLADFTEKSIKLEDLGKTQGDAWRSLQYDINRAKNMVRDYRAEMEAMRDNGTAYTTGGGEEADGLAERKEELLQELDDVSSEGQSVAAKIGASIGRALLSGVKGAFRTIGKFFASIGRHAVGIVSRLRDWRREHNLINNAAKATYRVFTNLFRMLRTRIKRTFISTVFSNMRESFHDLVQFSPRLNAAVSSIVGSLKTFSAQFMAAFEPLIVAIAPILTRIIDMMTAGAQRLAQLIAAVTGNNKWIQASKGQYNYAASLDKSAKSAKNAAKANEELKASVMSYDELNRRAGDDTTVDTSAFDLSDADLPVDETTSLLDRLYHAFVDRDWQSVGSLVSEGINSAFAWLGNTFGWTANGERILAFLDGFKLTVNSFIDGLDGLGAGTAFGDVINSGIGILDSLTDPKHGLNFGRLGTKIGDFLKGALRKINWKTLGKSLVNGIQGLLRGITGVLKGSEGESLMAEIGAALRELLGGAIDAFNPDDWSDSFAEIINGISDFISELLKDQSKITEFGKKLADMINKVFEKVDPDSLASAISSLAQTFTHIITSVIGNIDWGAILGKLWDVLTSDNMNWGSIASAIGILMAPSLIKGLIGQILKSAGLGGGAGSGAASSGVLAGLGKIGVGLAAFEAGGAIGVNGAAWLDKNLGGNGNYMTEEWADEYNKHWLRNSFLSFGAAVLSPAALFAPEWYANTMNSWREKYGLENAPSETMDTFKGPHFAEPIPESSHIGWRDQEATTVLTGVDRLLDGYNGFNNNNNNNSDTPSWFTSPDWTQGSTASSEFEKPSWALPDTSVAASDGTAFTTEFADTITQAQTDANQGHISTAVTDEVVDKIVGGVHDSIMEAVSIIREDNDSGGDIVLRIDSEEVARANMRGMKKINKRYNPFVELIT